MENVQNTYDYEENIIGENLHVRNQETSLNITKNKRILRVYIQIYKLYDEILIKDQEENK